MESKGKQVTENFANEVDAYWLDRDNESVFTCPNVSLFRLIGSAGGSLSNKQVLEVGFGNGADLMECKRRGADIAGLDLNPKCVEKVRAESQCDVRQFRAGSDDIPFEQAFDLIYSRDTIYYLTDIELSQFFVQCSENLTNNGTLIVQFIETDLKLKEGVSQSTQYFDAEFLSQYEPHLICTEVNPIRFLVADDVIRIAESNALTLVGTKKLIQSYDLHESEFRVDKYLVFARA